MKKTAKEDSDLKRKAFSSLNKENRCLEYSKVTKYLNILYT